VEEVAQKCVICNFGKKLSKVNDHPLGENSPCLAALDVVHFTPFFRRKYIPYTNGSWDRCYDFKNVFADKNAKNWRF
jgi:hypothetical protein